MNNLIIQIVKNENLMTTLFALDEYYETSFFYGEMGEYALYDSNELEYRRHYLRNQYIAENTEWLYKDQDSNLYGVLNDFVVISDNEGALDYFCKNFQDIPSFLRRWMEEMKRYEKFKDKINRFYSIIVEDEWNKYINFCNNNNLPLTILTNDEDFGQYAEKETFDKFIENEIKKMSEYL